MNCVRIILCAMMCAGYLLTSWSSVLYAEEPAFESIPVGKVEDGVSIFDHDATGKRIWELHGSAANFLDDGYIEIIDVTMIFYGDSDDDAVTLESPSAQVNQTEKKVRTEQPVTITAHDIVVSGEGLDGNMENSSVRIREEVVVVLRGKNKNMFFPDVETKIDHNENNF